MCLQSCCRPGNVISGKERRTVGILSIIFVVIFSGFIGIQNLQSTLNNEGGRGIISLSVVYACFILSSFFAPSFIQVLSPKGCLILGFIAHVVYTASNLHPVFWTLLPASAFVGITSGPIWTTQGMYISHCAISFSQTQNVPLKEIFGKFHGIFFFSFAFPRLLGNSLSSIILMQGHYNETTTNALESGKIKVCGADLCPEHSVTEIQFSLPDPLTVKILMSVFVTFSIIGLLLCIFLLPPLPTTVTSTNNSVIRKMLSATCFCLRVNTEVEMILFIPSIVLLSSVETFRWIGVSKAYISCPFGVQFVGFSMAVHGLLSGVSSIFLPRLANLISRKYVVTSLIIGITITHAVFLIWTPINDELPQMMGFISIQGVLEGGLSTMLCAFLSFMYPKKTDAAFASLATWKSLGNTAFILLAYYLCENARLYIIYALCILSMTTYVALELRLRLRKNKPEIDDEQEDESNKELKMSDD